MKKNVRIITIVVFVLLLVSIMTCLVGCSSNDNNVTKSDKISIDSINQELKTEVYYKDSLDCYYWVLQDGHLLISFTNYSDDEIAYIYDNNLLDANNVYVLK